MNLKKLDFRELSEIRYEFYEVPFPSTDCMTVLLVKFVGDCGFGSGSNGDALFMSAMIAAGFKAWDPSGLILDLRELRYEWGDMMCMLFYPPHDLIDLDDKGIEFPFAAVTSDLNREGLTSLVSDEMMSNPKELLFESLQKALCKVDRMGLKLYGET